MCSFEDLQQQIAALDTKLDSYHDDSERRFENFDSRLSVIETNYLTRGDIQRIITASIEVPMNQILQKLDTLTMAVQSNADNIAIHDRKLSPRRQLWHGVKAVWHNRKTINKILLVLGGAATALVNLWALWALIAERLMM